MNDPMFYTKRGLHTRYAFRCGYSESKRGLSLFMEHGVYHVRGFRENASGETFHIMGSFSHVMEARKFMSHPFSHVVSRDGSASLTRK